MSRLAAITRAASSVAESRLIIGDWAGHEDSVAADIEAARGALDAAFRLLMGAKYKEEQPEHQ